VGQRTLFFPRSHFLALLQVFYDPLAAQLKDERLNLIFGNGTPSLLPGSGFFFETRFADTRRSQGD
jgi:hypothetical protein